MMGFNKTATIASDSQAGGQTFSWRFLSLHTNGFRPACFYIDYHNHNKTLTSSTMHIFNADNLVFSFMANQNIGPRKERKGAG